VYTERAAQPLCERAIDQAVDAPVVPHAIDAVAQRFVEQCGARRMRDAPVVERGFEARQAAKAFGPEAVALRVAEAAPLPAGVVARIAALFDDMANPLRAAPLRVVWHAGVAQSRFVHADAIFEG
jgi:hypothetical protein